MKKTFKRNALLLMLLMVVFLFAVDVFAGETQNVTKGFRSFSANRTGCWFCALFKTIFCAGNAMAISIFNALARSCVNLAAIIMALWVCWMVFKLFLGFSSDASGFFANFFKAFVVFVSCVFILDSRYGGGANFVFDTFINPILEATADLSVSIMKAGFEGAKENAQVVDLSGGANYDPSASVLNEMNGEPFYGEFESLGNPTCSVSGGFSNETLLKFLQMIQAMNLKLIQVMVAGKALWNTGFNQEGLIGLNFDYIFSGLLLMIVAVWILISTMFKLVDAVIRMLFSCALLPLYIMFWIFPKTRGYTTAAVKMFVTSMCFFVITATLLTFAIILIGGNKIKSALRTLENSNSYSGLTDGFSMSKGGFLLTVATSIIATSLIDMADPLASTFGGSSAPGGAGAALRGAVGKAAGGATSLAGGVAKKGAAAVGNAGLKAAGAGYRKLKIAVANKLSKGAGGGKSFGGGEAGKANATDKSDNKGDKKNA